MPPGVDLSHIPIASPPPGQKSNFINPPSLAPVAEIVGSLLIAIETIILVFRTCSNVKTFGRIRLEDYWTIFAAILTYGDFIVIMYLRPLARHGWDIPLTEPVELILKLEFSQYMLTGPVLFFSKSSLLLLYYRIFSPDRIFRYKLYGAFVFIAAVTLSAIPVILSLCLPESGHIWVDTVASCSKANLHGYVMGPANVAFDIFLMYLPASVIVHLHLPLRRKLGILAIFLTGVLALIASIIALIYRIQIIHSQNALWQAYILDLCILVEACISVICSCMPAIPAISHMIKTNGYIMALQSRLRSRYASSDKSSSSSNQPSGRKPYPGDQNSDEADGYIGLVRNGADHVDTPSGIKTHIEHVGRRGPLDNRSISMFVELEMTSTRTSRRESSEG
ncbi:hypothetical protein MMC07_001437 [Pseudocyphellaria aurata]|nr:hypothetical protein [Pseudocyphellaria aurata]